MLPTGATGFWIGDWLWDLLLVTMSLVVHGIEASLWAVAYVWLGASPDFTHAIFFSLQMITTLGADIVFIDAHWKLMGPLEAMSGMLLFGLSTAFLLAVLQRTWPIFAKERGD